MWHMVFIVLGLICFFAAAFNFNPPKCNIGWLGALFIGVSLFFI